MSYSTAHWRRVVDETRRMVAEVPLYRDRPQPPADPAEVDAWLSQVPPVGKRELRRGFPKALVRLSQDLSAAMRSEQVTLLATSGTTADRLQVIWEWSWWDPQEREAMRLNARIAKSLDRADYREALQELRGGYRQECLACGADFVELDTSMRFDKALVEYLAQRKARF